ncbi:MAG TPA: hypothetical protein VI757_12605, partial [Bacteroidia bacterium]|nr:hypothetical protein [Bacteroidia bacterium]
MKTKLLLTILFAFIYCTVNAQVQKQSPSNTIKKFTTGIKRPLPEVKFKGLYNPPSVDLKWKPILKNQVPENDIVYDEKLEALKRENAKIKKEWEEQRKSLKDEKSLQAVTPVIGINYLGNPYNGCPPDNSIAISNGGIIVATANSTIEYDDMSGNNLYWNYLEGTSGFFGDTLTSICDASVIYDSGADRFIMVTQTCHGNSTSSEVIICFSQTNNPQNGWWVYRFNGDVLNDNHWFDFPRIAVSTNEVYVSGNLFTNTPYAFYQTCLFQMTKSVGYSGGSYNATNSGVWTGINDGDGNPSFTLVPVQYGQQGNYGPGVYLVSNIYLGGSSLYLY